MNCSNIFKTLIILCLLTSCFSLTAQANYKIRVPHSIDFICEEGTGGNTGFWGIKVVWGDYPEASGYQIISHHGAFGSGSVGGDVHEWSVLGGSPVEPGGCPAKEADLNPSWYQNIYEVWATFPTGGNLELHKTDNVYGAAHPGDEIRYFLVYKNTGRYPLLDCIVQESWPAYMKYVAGGNPNGTNSVTWDFGTMNPGQWRQVELVLRISEDLPRSVSEIYNVAVVHPAPSPTPAPSAVPGSTTSGSTGFSVSRCDALRCNVVYGDAEWIDRPDETTFNDLIPYDIVRGNDDVQLVSGYTSFNHTVATGTLLLFDGGFGLTHCPDLPDNVLSEITLNNPSSIEHSVSGIMNAKEHVKVVGHFLTLEIHKGRYTFTGETTCETVDVESGRVIIIDPDGDRHNIGPGGSFTWPIIIGDPPDRGNGPQLVSTDPDDFGSVRFTDVIINYEFDQPVLSVGEDSNFALGETAGVWQGCGTFDELAGKVNVTWNTEKTIMTIGIPGTFPWLGFDLAGGMTLVAMVHLTDVESASGTTDDIFQALTLFCTAQTSSQGSVNSEFEHFAFITEGNGHLSSYGEWNLQQLQELPGPLPEGLYQAGPAFEFEFLGTVLDNYWLQLRPSLKFGLPPGLTGGGIYSWTGTEWEMARQGFGLEWTWTEALVDSHQILVLLTTMTRPEIPEVISIHPSIQAGPVSGDIPLVIQVASKSGIRAEMTNIEINGQRTMSFDPSTGTIIGWTVEENSGIVTLTHTPSENWAQGQLVYGHYYIPAHFGLIPAEGDFAFQVAYTDTTDADGDGMHDAWEDANGLDSSVDDSAEDPDGDSFSNFMEFTYRSHPCSSASLPAMPWIDLLSNQEAYYQGDDMTLRARVTNGPVDTPVDLYIVLEILGGYYFWPAFTTDVVPLGFTMPANIDVTFDLFAYTWDEIPMILQLNWYGAFVDPQNMYLYSLDILSVLLDQ